MYRSSTTPSLLPFSASHHRMPVYETLASCIFLCVLNYSEAMSAIQKKKNNNKDPGVFKSCGQKITKSSEIAKDVVNIKKTVEITLMKVVTNIIIIVIVNHPASYFYIAFPQYQNRFTSVRANTILGQTSHTS